MFKSKRIFQIVSTIVTIVLICLVLEAFNSQANLGVTGSVSPQHKLTPEEIAKQNESTEAIHIKGIGEFRRVASVPAVNPSEIVYSKDLKRDLLTAKTRVMVLDYGVFVKVTDSDETTFKMTNNSNCDDSFEWQGKTYVKKNVENKELLEPGVKGYVKCINGKLLHASDDVYPNIIIYDAPVTSDPNDVIINKLLYSPIPSKGH